MKVLFLALALCLSLPFTKAQEKIELSTEITQVTVFSIGAQVHRLGSVKVEAGKTILKVKGITPDLDPKSIQIKVGDELTVLSVFHDWNTTNSDFDTKTIDSLNLVLKNYDWLVQHLKIRQNVLDQKENVLHSSSQVKSDISEVSAAQLDQILKLFETTYMETGREKLMIDRQLDSLERLKTKLALTIKSIRGTPLETKSEIDILVNAPQAVTSEIELSYIVRNAGWIPTYDIRSRDISQPIHITYKGEVHQQTGEVWKNVNLTFSNASPYSRQSAPELMPWKLTTIANTTFKRIGPAEISFGTRMVTGVVRNSRGEPLIFANVLVDGHNLGTQTDLDGNFSILVPSDANSLNVASTGYALQNIPVTSSFLDINMREGIDLDEVSVSNIPTKSINAINAATAGLSTTSRVKRMNEQATVIIDNQVSVEFTLEMPTTILSDGKNTSLEMQTYDIPAEYRYETTPKMDRGAYLIATLTNWEQYHLIEGQANLYFNNTYIGKTILDPLNLSDTLEISLGRDPDIIVERIKSDEFTKKTFLGNNIVVEKSFKLSFRNKKDYPIHIRVSDQIPVSIHDAISVSTTQLSDGVLDESSGIIKWNLDISAAANKDVVMSYAVKYPSKEHLLIE